jgi:hypothetical protein
MKLVVVTVEQFEDSPEGDNGLSAHERHQLILTEDERFLGIIMCFQGADPIKIDLPS